MQFDPLASIASRKCAKPLPSFVLDINIYNKLHINYPIGEKIHHFYKTHTHKIKKERRREDATECKERKKNINFGDHSPQNIIFQSQFYALK